MAKAQTPKGDSTLMVAGRSVPIVAGQARPEMAGRKRGSSTELFDDVYARLDQIEESLATGLTSADEKIFNDLSARLDVIEKQIAEWSEEEKKE